MIGSINKAKTNELITNIKNVNSNTVDPLKQDVHQKMKELSQLTENVLTMQPGAFDKTFESIEDSITKIANKFQRNQKAIEEYESKKDNKI